MFPTRRHGHGRGGFAVKTLTRRQWEALLEAFTGHPDGLPPPEVAEQVPFIEEYLRSGAPELPGAFRASYHLLNIISLLTRGRTFTRLDPARREELLNRLLSSRNPLPRGVAILLALPVLTSYYRRPEVAVPLGFDARALREEAALRVVSRERTLPPREVTDEEET